MDPTQYDTTAMACGTAARTYYYCRKCGRDCGYMDRAGHDTTTPCKCWSVQPMAGQDPQWMFTPVELARLQFAKWLHDHGVISR